MTKLDEALGLFPFCIKSGEHWSATCQDVLDAARAELTDLRTQLATAKEVIRPFALLAELDAKDKDGLETVYPMVAAGRLHDARRFLSLKTEQRGEQK